MELMEDKLWRLVKALSLKHSLIGASRSSDEPSTIKRQVLSIDTQFLKLQCLFHLKSLYCQHTCIFKVHRSCADLEGWVWTPPPPLLEIFFFNLHSKNYRKVHLRPSPPRSKQKLPSDSHSNFFSFGVGGYSRMLFVTKIWTFLNLFTELFIKKQLVTWQQNLPFFNSISFDIKVWNKA